MATDYKPRRCRECGEGTMAPLARAGRTMPYRNMLALPVPADLQIPTCDHCGTEWIDGATSSALEEALKRSYGEELSKRLKVALSRLAEVNPASQRKIERLLGLSQGYLSRLANDRGAPSPRVVSALALLAQDPERRLRELEQLWGPEFAAA